MRTSNRLGLAAGLAAALALSGAARAQGSGATGTAGSDTGATPGGAAAAGSSETTTTPSTGTSDTATTTGGGHRPAGAASDRQATAGETATGTATGKVDRKLEQGLQKLHAANEAEVEMGEMAAGAARDEQVKAYAQKMVDDHGAADRKLQEVAQQAGVSLTGPAYEKARKDAEKEMKKIHAKADAADFDRRYMSHMVKDHQKDVKEVGSLSKQAHRSNQHEVAAFLDETHVAMQAHLQEAKQIEQATRSGQRQGRRGAAGSAPSRPGMEPQGDTGAPGAGSERYVPPPTEENRGSGPTGSGTPEPGHKQ